jgi:hypothetical protein
MDLIDVHQKALDKIDSLKWVYLGHQFGFRTDCIIYKIYCPGCGIIFELSDYRLYIDLNRYPACLCEAIHRTKQSMILGEASLFT